MKIETFKSIHTLKASNFEIKQTVTTWKSYFNILAGLVLGALIAYMGTKSGLILIHQQILLEKTDEKNMEKTKVEAQPNRAAG
ncbi:MAG: hypothetical protein NT144_12095 [Bacteroidia bacterium]|nr:hypothetical protein [Bacteroidia bacterium]